ncbi:MAG: hypothetical protein JWM11_5212 [Planctomycetaceae bacterium]|nr:hypothetical protein [Planctomycetaceae bacterium]
MRPSWLPGLIVNIGDPFILKRVGNSHIDTRTMTNSHQKDRIAPEDDVVIPARTDRVAFVVLGNDRYTVGATTSHQQTTKGRCHERNHHSTEDRQ